MFTRFIKVKYERLDFQKFLIELRQYLKHLLHFHWKLKSAKKKYFNTIANADLI